MNVSFYSKDKADAIFVKSTDIPVTSVNNKTGAVTLTASDVGAGSASDVASAVVTAQGAATNARNAALEIAAHKGNTNNPHGVTAAQVKAVSYEQQTLTDAQKAQARENIGAIASAPVASVNGQTGAVVLDGGNINYAPGKTINAQINTIGGWAEDALIVAQSASGEIDDHKQDTGNPHFVTADQVGALPISDDGVVSTPITLLSDGGDSAYLKFGDSTLDPSDGTILYDDTTVINPRDQTLSIYGEYPGIGSGRWSMDFYDDRGEYKSGGIAILSDIPPVDAAISPTSTNPVANKAVYEAVQSACKVRSVNGDTGDVTVRRVVSSTEEIDAHGDIYARAVEIGGHWVCKNDSSGVETTYSYVGYTTDFGPRYHWKLDDRNNVYLFPAAGKIQYNGTVIETSDDYKNVNPTVDGTPLKSFTFGASTFTFVPQAGQTSPTSSDSLERRSNKVTSVDGTSTDDQYPTAKAVVAALPYPIEEIPVTKLGALRRYYLKDRTVNIVRIDYSWTSTAIGLVFPERVDGKARDFIAKVIITVDPAPSISIVNSSNYNWEYDDDSWSVLEPGVNELYFSENEQ